MVPLLGVVTMSLFSSSAALHGGFRDPPPAVGILPATAIGPTRATLNGQVGGSNVTSYFQYALWGTTSNISTPEQVTNGFVEIHANIDGLTCNTRYMYQVLAFNDGGFSSAAAPVSFVTSPCGSPDVATAAVSDITLTSATLNGAANPDGNATDASFQYGLTTNYGAGTPTQSLGTGTSSVPIGGGGISGLTCGTVYHFRAVANNTVATVATTDATFMTTTCAVPVVVTDAPTGIAPRSATLKGTAIPTARRRRDPSSTA
jgi:trimeric autotransporter adhesin